MTCKYRSLLKIVEEKMWNLKHNNSTNTTNNLVLQFWKNYICCEMYINKEEIYFPKYQTIVLLAFLSWCGWLHAYFPSIYSKTLPYLNLYLSINCLFYGYCFALFRCVQHCLANWSVFLLISMSVYLSLKNKWFWV